MYLYYFFCLFFFYYSLFIRISKTAAVHINIHVRTAYPGVSATNLAIVFGSTDGRKTLVKIILQTLFILYSAPARGFSPSAAHRIKPKRVKHTRTRGNRFVVGTHIIHVEPGEHFVIFVVVLFIVRRRCEANGQIEMPQDSRVRENRSRDFIFYFYFYVETVRFNFGYGYGVVEQIRKYNVGRRCTDTRIFSVGKMSIIRYFLTSRAADGSYYYSI